MHFGNPFDLETNRVELHILQPDNSRCILSFFYNRKDNDSLEIWEARFAPKQYGIHHVSFVINGKIQEQFELEIDKNVEKKQGGLVLSEKLGTFQYESGEPFRGIGINICWAEDYEYYFKKMRASGMNITRIWMCPWHLSFEWSETGLGKYNLQTAERLDSILALAEKYGVFIILCMDYHGIARKGLGYFRENRWAVNPYNKINGGPCETSPELFTNYEAKEFFKRKYKYIVSRYGCSPQIASWEFFNEADLMAGKSLAVNRWHIEMAEYIQSIDLHNRLVSTSSTRSYPEKVVDAFKSAAMDFIMFHDYNKLDWAPFVTDLHEAAIEYYQKPVVLAEFGVEYRSGERTFKLDSLHVGIHNAVWSGWFSETPISPLSWWWDSYIDKYNIWNEYAFLSRFTERIDLNADHLVFKTLPAGSIKSDPQTQALSMVRCIYFGSNAALWFKNEFYQWSRISEGEKLNLVGEFLQQIPDMPPGSYTISWYDPQEGKFLETKTEAEADQNGILFLTVPAFLKDLSCLVIQN
jgi:hypothetical protein